TLGKCHAAGRLVRNLQTLTLGGEQHGVITYDVTATHSGEADRFALTDTRVTLTTIDGDLAQIAAQRIGNDLTHTHRRARRRVNLVAMMSFNDLDVGIFTHH